MIAESSSILLISGQMGLTVPRIQCAAHADYMKPLSIVAGMLLCSSSLAAMDTELRLGPKEFVVGGELMNEYIDQGSLRHDDVPGRFYMRGRYANIGFELDTVFAISEDDRTGNDPLEIVETDLRLDYLVTLPERAQIIPFLENETYPNFSRPHEALWLGVDGWYLLPYEGVEVGGSLAVDLTGDVGWRGSIGARQLFQIHRLIYKVIS